MAWYNPSWLDEVASAVVPAAATLGGAYLGGGNVDSRAVLSALRSGSKGYAENEAEKRAQEYQEHRNQAIANANLINTLSPSANFRPQYGEVPEAGLLEKVAGGVDKGISAFETAEKANMARRQLGLDAATSQAALDKAKQDFQVAEGRYAAGGYGGYNPYGEKVDPLAVSSTGTGSATDPLAVSSDIDDETMANVDAAIEGGGDTTRSQNRDLFDVAAGLAIDPATGLPLSAPVREVAPREIDDAFMSQTMPPAPAPSGTYIPMGEDFSIEATPEVRLESALGARPSRASGLQAPVEGSAGPFHNLNPYNPRFLSDTEFAPFVGASQPRFSPTTDPEILIRDLMQSQGVSYDEARSMLRRGSF